jgi:divalent metal cation (Fe/Co/Zn/Cd) transporter
MRTPFRHPPESLEAALAISWLTVTWSTCTGLASAAEGLRSHNLSLAGLGVTVLIDVLSSAVLIWRFRHERAGGVGDRAERLAHRVASIALVAFGLVLAVQAVRHLADHARPASSGAGVALAAAGLLVQPLLARRKYRVADAVGSGALRADAHITMVGAAIAGVTLVGLAARALVGWWWADAVAALVLAAVAGRQGLGGLRHRHPDLAT